MRIKFGLMRPIDIRWLLRGQVIRGEFGNHPVAKKQTEKYNDNLYS